MSKNIIDWIEWAKLSCATLYRDSVTRFFASGFFHESVSTQPQSIPRDRFEFFWKFAEILASQGAPPVSMIPVANFATSFTSVVDTGGKLPPVSLGTAEALKWTWRQKGTYKLTSQSSLNKIIKAFMIEDFFLLPPVSTTSVVHLELWISARFFEKNLKRP